MNQILNVEGKFFSITSKMVDMVAITIFWLIGCIPLVTILTSTASMYHTTVKCIRYERGSVCSTFIKAYKKNLKQGISITVFYGIVGALVGFANAYVFGLLNSGTKVPFVLVVALLMITIFYLINVLWLGCVFSRFSLAFKELIQLDFVISIKYIFKSILLLLLVALSILLILVSFPLAIIVPSLTMLLLSYLSEPCLHRYMPKQKEDNGDWRYGF